MRRIVGYDYIIASIILITFSCVSITNIFSCSSKYYVTALLPIVYILGFFVWGVWSSNNAVLLKKLIMLLMAIKMVLIPGLILINHGLVVSGFDSNIYKYIPDAVILQIIEYTIVIIYITFLNWTKYSIDNNPIAIEGNDNEMIASRSAWRILGVCIVIIIGTIVVYPSFLNRLRPIFFVNETAEILWKQKADIALNSLPAILYYPLNWLFLESRLALAYMVIVKLYNSRVRLSDGIKLFLSLVSTIVILILIVPDSVATSVYAALTLFLLLYMFYPGKRKSIVFVVTAVCIAVLIGAFVIMPMTSGRGISISYIASKLNAYFSGYLNTSAAVAMNNYSSSRFEMLAGDFLRSLPIVRGFFTSMPMSNELFNMALGYDTIYNSQIIPLEGQGYYYLRHVGTILFTILHMHILKNYYYKMLNTRSSFTFFIYGTLTLLMTFGLVMYGLFLNFSLVLSQIPLLLINYLFVRRYIVNHKY